MIRVRRAVMALVVIAAVAAGSLVSAAPASAFPGDVVSVSPTGPYAPNTIMVVRFICTADSPYDDGRTLVKASYNISTGSGTHGPDQPVTLIGTESGTSTFEFSYSDTRSATVLMICWYGGSYYSGVGSSVEYTIAVPTTTVLSGATSTSYGASASLTATVTSETGSPSGSVTFHLGSTDVPVALSDGVATLDLGTLTPGDYVVTATYTGSGEWTASESGASTVRVNKASSAVRIDAPSVTWGAASTATVQVASVGRTPTGLIGYRLDGDSGYALLADGTALLALGSLEPGDHTLVVSYAGDDYYDAVIASTTVHVDPSAPTITAETLPRATVDAAYDHTFLSAGHPAPAWALAAGSGLPPGLSLASSTGQVSGTPTVAGSYTFTLTANNGATASQTFSLTVDPAQFTGASLTVDVVDNGGATIDRDATAVLTSAVAPTSVRYDWYVGATLAQSGASPTFHLGSGAANKTVTAVAHIERDEYMPADVQSDPFVVAPVAPVIATASVPDGTFGASYSARLDASGDPRPDWRLAPGDALPDGLTLATDGTITGSPTTDGDTTFSVVADNGLTATKQFTITIAKAEFAGAGVDVAWSDDGGGRTIDATLTASVHSTPAPSTVTYDFVVGGTVEQSGASNTFHISSAYAGRTVHVVAHLGREHYVDVDAESAPRLIAPITPVITTDSLPDGTVDADYDTQLLATGDPVPSWHVSRGVLPAGLELTTAGRLHGTPIADGDATIEVTADNGATASAELDLHIAPAAYSSVPVPTIDGSATFGETLTAVESASTPTSTPVYQWRVSGTDVAGATGTAFDLDNPAWVGGHVTVAVTVHRDGYADVTAESEPLAVAARQFTAGPTVGIEGAARVGQPLDAVVGESAPSADRYVYRWFADDVLIPGATGARFAPSAAEEGTSIRVEIDAVRAGYVTAGAGSDVIGPVVADPAPVANDPVPVGTDPAPVATPAAPAKLRVTAPSRVITGEKSRIRATGLAPAEVYTVTIGGRIVAHGTASASGVVNRLVAVPKSLAAGVKGVAGVKRAVVVTGSASDRTGRDTTIANRLVAPRVARAATWLRASRDETITVSRLLPGERVRVVYNGHRISPKKAAANSRGRYRLTFDVGENWGRRTLVVTAGHDGRHTVSHVTVSPFRAE
ncbi:Ig-like domain repeat protein [Galbitalea sp. SE-J8]|uniref:Ig-like domain repeat protein n=1 Tax=Galbitalea sp. SE-J8 TaxID=3054952 RepID=UPI00259CAF42|nr:Ig-like domain repeat protein [Galbitalea sp. SE-J8]MDM4763863.1 Ig-like domain repeat protein [Galbitalea sp. SE-J8]